MYLREALIQCRDLEAEVAHVYEELAVLHSSEKKLSEFWGKLARDEKQHARILAALLAAEEVQEDDGPFVVDLRTRIGELRRLVGRAYGAVRSGIAAGEAIELAAEIERSEIDVLFAELLILARPALVRLAAIVDNGEAIGQRHQRRVERLRRRNLAPVPAHATGS